METVNVFFWILVSTVVSSYGTGEFVRVCYFTSWSKYRQNIGKFDIEDIEPHMCTHLVWAFADIDGNSGGINAAGAGGRFRKFNSLKSTNPALKTLVSVGGEHAKDWLFRQVSVTNTSRWTFANSVVDFLVDNNFDGIDIDWEYPNEATKDQYILLLKTLREALDGRQPGLLLYVAVAAGIWTIDPGYNVPEMVKYVDLVNIMTYDYHVVGSEVAAFNSPLYSRPNFHYSLSVNYTVHYWHSLGLPYSKMTLGVTPVGRRYILQDAGAATPGAPVLSSSVKGPLYSIMGGLAYPEICQLINCSSATPTFDNTQKVPYVASGFTWVGYENPRSVRLKIALAKQLGLAGMMIWSLDQDDFTGQMCNEGKHPLMAAILNEAGIVWSASNTTTTSSSIIINECVSVTTPTTATTVSTNSSTNGQNQNIVSVNTPTTATTVSTNSPTNGQNQISQNPVLNDKGSAPVIFNVSSLYRIGILIILFQKFIE